MARMDGAALRIWEPRPHHCCVGKEAGFDREMPRMRPWTRLLGERSTGPLTPRRDQPLVFPTCFHRFQRPAFFFSSQTGPGPHAKLYSYCSTWWRSPLPLQLADSQRLPTALAGRSGKVWKGGWHREALPLACISQPLSRVAQLAQWSTLHGSQSRCWSSHECRRVSAILAGAAGCPPACCLIHYLQSLATQSLKALSRQNISTIIHR